MIKLQEVQEKIKNNHLFIEKGKEAKEYQNSLIKPRGSLGVLEDITIRLAEMTGQVKYNIFNKDVIILCADHGIANHGISAYPKDVTKHMARNYIGGGAGGSVIARANECRLTVVDVGIEGEFEYPGIIKRRVREGTRDFTQGPAMTIEEAVRAIEIGIEETEKLIKDGSQIIAPGEMGIGNTTASSALLAVFGDYSPEQVVGRGTLVNDETLKRKIDIVAKGIEVNKPSKAEPLDALAKLGGFEIAATVGVYLACAANRIPVVVDGCIASIAALAAMHIAPGTERFMFASHKSAEGAHYRILELLGLKPLFDFNMRLGEASGAIIAMKIIQTASKVISEMDTFSSGGVAVADKKLELESKE
ncbi:MAG: nicotinate-nucleotide--dimethylbenzimidazole phosphoribosyltransferase [Clostridia bacterium]|nr:nicotinate-nucleotide--dimethylbenzimidazole phosphoribosyltransferase [Clostridia bacterium]